MKYRLNLKLNALRRAARQSPLAFREALQLTNNQLRPANELFEDWQRTDFAALDDAWKRLAGFEVPKSTRLAYIERPRGHSKTSDMAVQLAWILAYGRPQLHGVAAAADQDQARLIRDAIARLIGLNPYFCKPLEVRQNEVLNPETGSRLSIISSDVKSSWGLLPDFVICDELCHWEKPDLWHSLFSAAAKKPDALLAILTNAGVGRNWQWELREHARTSNTWYFSTLDGPSAPWISSEFLVEQQRLLPEAIYDRIWNNRWQHTSGSFVSAQQVRACRDNQLSQQQTGQPHRQYFAAIDYAEKHDYTVGVVVHREGDAFVVDRMDVAVPSVDAPVLVSWVEEWIEQIADSFPQVSFTLDEYQLLNTIQRLSSRYDIRRFEFRAGLGNHKLAVNLRSLIVNRQLHWYPDCGASDELTPGDNLESELCSVILRQNATGRCRIDHVTNGVQHDDRVFALGAACLAAMEQSALQAEWMDVQLPNAQQEFAW